MWVGQTASSYGPLGPEAFCGVPLHVPCHDGIAHRALARPPGCRGVAPRLWLRTAGRYPLGVPRAVPSNAANNLRVLVQHPHAEGEISGVLTFVSAFSDFARGAGVAVEVLSTQRLQPTAWFRALRRNDVVLMNSNDLRFALIARLLRRPFVVRYHWKFFTDDEVNLQAGTVAQRTWASIWRHLRQAASPAAKNRRWHLQTAYRMWARYQVYRLATDRDACSAFIARTIGVRDPIYNWLPAQASVPIPGYEERDVDLTFLARVDRSKGIFTLLRALSRLDADHPPRVLVYGDGPDRAEAERLATELGLLNTVVRFAGSIPNTEARRVLSRSRWLVQPSEFFEILPLSPLEAAAVGTPTVGTSIGGLPESVGPGGLIVSPANQEELAAALSVALRDRELWERCSAAAQEHLRANFDPQVLGNRLLDRLRAACGR